MDITSAFNSRLRLQEVFSKELMWQDSLVDNVTSAHRQWINVANVFRFEINGNSKEELRIDYSSPEFTF
jgi:hypothetical protein